MKLHTDSLKGFLAQFLIFLALAIGGTLVFFYVYLPSVTNKGETITVPDLYGMKLEEMEDFLTKRNLRYEINDSTYSDEHEPLTILKQYPKPGSKVKENRKVFISVNRVTPPTVPMPELVDRSLRNAEAVLKSNELKRGKIDYVPSEFFDLILEMKQGDRVLKAGDFVSKGSIIDLTVGSGNNSGSLKAPKLVGLELDEALFYIRGSRLEPGIITVEGDTTEQKSVVIRQEPQEGSTVRFGDLVDLWIVPESDSLSQFLIEMNEEESE